MKTFTQKFVVAALVSASFQLNATNLPKNKEVNIYFQENKGQICDQNYLSRPDVLFSGSANGINYHLTNSGISYQLNRIESWKETEDQKTMEKIKVVDQTTFYRVDINWVGANLNSKIIKGNELPGVNNFYLAQCPNGALNVKSYNDITYQNIYNGIDLKWYEKNGELEYDFIVKPFANPEQIKIEIKGSETISINTKGELEIKTPLGTITEKVPVAFQNNKQVVTYWVVKNNIASFKIDNYDRTQTLIIDPALRKWGTYYGGTADEYGRDCKPDANGNVYLTGYTGSATTTLIATSGGHQTTFNGGSFDAFLAKFNSNGVRQWATYYGGTADDISLSVEALGANVYITGYTASTGSVIATAGSHQSANAGGVNDAFLVKFDQNGLRIWATFYGGGGNDSGRGCSADALGNVYLTGHAGSPTGFSTAGAHQTTYGGADAFLVKFDANGVRLWGTYYGGSTGIEYATDCAIDASGMVYISGYCSGATGTVIATAGSHQSAFTGGTNDAFLAKFNSSGVRLWGTFYGGSLNDMGHSCTTDASGNVFMIGETSSATTTLIASAGTQQTSFGGGTSDAFLVKFNSAGVRQWGTYYGGTGDDYGYGCSLDYYNNLLITGSTTSGTNISTAGSHQVALSGTADGYLADFNSSTGLRVWGTYYGGTGLDYSRACSVDNNGYIYLAGFGNSSTANAIATPGSHQAVLSGLNDAFLVQLADCPSTTVTIVGTNSICSGQSVTLSATGAGFTTYLWNNSSTAASVVVSPSVTTAYSVTAGSGPLSCNASNSFTLSVTTTPTVVVTPTSSVHCIGSATTIISASGATTYSWSTGSTASSISVTPTAFTVYTVTGYNGSCTNVKTSTIAASATPTVLVSGTPTQSFCTGTSLTLTAFGASTYTWSNGPLTFSNVVSPTVTTNYTVTGSNGLCTDTYFVIVNPVLTPTVNLNSSTSAICTGGSATLTASGAASYSWNTTATTSSIIVSPSVTTNYTVTGYNGACIDTKTTNIGIATSITVAAVSNTSSICSGSSATLTANGASTYTWNTGSNATSIVITPTSSSNYTVNGTSGSCSGSVTININVNPNPTVSVVSTSTLICVGETASLTANGANAYTWNTGDNTAAITVTPSGTTVYTVTGYSASGCSNTSTFTQAVSACAGLNDLSSQLKDVFIYPNPASDKLHIETNFVNFDIMLYDTYGKIIYLEKNQVANATINVKELSKGFYILKLNSNFGFVTKKIIVE
ncbi:MAG: T9SS type A sorting domain-containing protein [Bacteroidia bacterium]|nr:T9SS type A sorting domain-containing protein [Bacteroidia bacterium]